MRDEEVEVAGWEEEKTGKEGSTQWECWPRKAGQVGLGWPGNIEEGMKAGGRRRGEQLSILG